MNNMLATLALNRVGDNVYSMFLCSVNIENSTQATKMWASRMTGMTEDKLVYDYFSGIVQRYEYPLKDPEINTTGKMVPLLRRSTENELRDTYLS